MTLHQFLCGSTVMIILLSNGCHSQQPVCGRALRNTRIVGGRNASPGSWPWLASLNNDGGPFCAGSLIHNQWVLTAAHCLTGNELLNTTVYLGRLSQSGPNANEVSRGLESIICHPSYDFLTNENDICLLKLSAPVDFTDYIQPVCLASTGSTFHSGVSSWVTGFGDTQAGPSATADILQEVNVPIIGNNECKCTYPFITDSMICAGFREGGKDACQGDSGAPLVTKKDFMWIQSGIVSFGKGCANPMTPGVYTRVSQYQEWITNITDSSEPGFVAHTASGVDSDLNITCSNIPPTGAAINTTTTTRTTTMIPTTTTTPSIPTTATITKTAMIPTTATTPSIPTTATITKTTDNPSTTMISTTATTPSIPTTTTITKTTENPSTTMIPTTATTPSIPTTTTITKTTENPSTTMIPTTSTTPSIPTTATITKTTDNPSTTMIPTTTTTTTTPSTPTIPIITKPLINEAIGSVFDGGDHVIHFSHFTSLCLLVVSLFVLVGET